MATGAAGMVRLKMRVIFALLLREMRTRFGKTPLGFVWAVIEPLSFVAGMSYVFVLMHRPAPYGSSMPLFFATGMLPFYLFRRTVTRLIPVLDRNEALFGTPGIAPTDAFFARTLLELITYITVMVITFSGLILLLGVAEPDRIYIMGMAIALLTLFAFGFGITSCLISLAFPLYGRLMNMLLRVLMFCSAVFMPLESTPVFIRDWFVWNPVVHGIELFRSGYYMSYRCSPLDVGYLLSVGLALTLVGLMTERSIRMRSE